MQKMNFSVDFNDVKDKQDIILRISNVFKLHDISGFSWDSFEDYFTTLDPDSEIIRNAKPKPEKVHLIVKNIEDVKSISEKDYKILLSILEDTKNGTNKDPRDKIQFTYEIE